MLAQGQRFLRNRTKFGKQCRRLVLDLVIAVTQDTLMTMQAMNLQQQVGSNVAATQPKMRESLTRVTRKILLIESELTRMIEHASCECAWLGPFTSRPSAPGFARSRIGVPDTMTSTASPRAAANAYTGRSR